MMRQSYSNRAFNLKRTGIACGCVALLVVGLVSGVVYFACSGMFAQMMGERTYDIPGDTSHFDPFASLPEVRKRIPAGSKLVSIEATFVRSDGTMDLNADYTPFPQTTYKFIHLLDKAPDNAPPIGAGRGPDDQWYEEVIVGCWRPGQTRSVSKTSGNVRTRYTYKHLGMDVDIRDPQAGKPEEGIPDPKCSTQKLWEMAISKGADRNAVARIEYDKDGYEFRIDRTNVRFRCDAGCQVLK
jgi:hypothetical protein